MKHQYTPSYVRVAVSSPSANVLYVELEKNGVLSFTPPAAPARPAAPAPPVSHSLPAGILCTRPPTIITDTLSIVCYSSAASRDEGRGLHSSTFQLNLSALYGIGGARGACVARIKGVFRVCSCVRHGSSRAEK